MEWKDVRSPEDVIDMGKKRYGDFRTFLPWVILGFFVFFWVYWAQSILLALMRLG